MLDLEMADESTVTLGIVDLVVGLVGSLIEIGGLVREVLVEKAVKNCMATSRCCASGYP